MGSVLAEDIFAVDDLPPFRASVMDGYAVSDLDFSQLFTIVDVKMLAGTNPDVDLVQKQSQAVYVTTGGPVPTGFISVVPIEEVQLSDGKLDLRQINKSDYKEGSWIRGIGSDIKQG